MSNSNEFVAALNELGHDAPLLDQSHDIYRRWPVASAISQIIASAPPGWSTRIAVIGEWGEGKTTVLNFLEKQQTAQKNVVVRFSSWGASTEEDVWQIFSANLLLELRRNGIRLWWLRIKHFLKTFKSLVASLSSAAGKGLDAAGYVGASAATEFAASSIRKAFGFSADDVRNLSTHLDGKRVVVFIDDLDRTDPRLVPKVLLSMRELLDFSRFIFVLAFDKRIVSRSLSEYHPAMGPEGEEFLDKVLDFTLALPRPSKPLVLRLAKERFKAICSFVPDDVLDSLAEFLPENPRKLKMFARMISAMKSEAARHGPEELDWRVIALLTLIRSESHAFAENLMQETVRSDSHSWLGWAMADTSEKRKQRDAHMQESIALHPELKGKADRMRRMTAAWYDQLPYTPSERLAYQARFALTPDIITWKEFDSVIHEWKTSRDLRVVVNFLGDRQKAATRSIDDVIEEFFESIVGSHAMSVERSSEVSSAAANREQLERAVRSLELLRDMLTSDLFNSLIGRNALLIAWGRLFHTSMQWRHFQSNEGESHLRTLEVEILRLLSTRLNDALAVLGLLRPWDRDGMGFDRRTDALRREFVEELCEQIVPSACEEVLARYVDVPRAVRQIQSKSEHAAARYLLTSKDSPLLNGRRRELISHLIAREGTMSAMEDAGDYLGVLSQEGILRAVSARVPELLVTLWNLSVSKPLQYRGRHDHRETRQKLIDAGVTADTLDTPEWLKDRPDSR